MAGNSILLPSPPDIIPEHSLHNPAFLKKPLSWPGLISGSAPFRLAGLMQQICVYQHSPAVNILLVVMQQTIIQMGTLIR